MISKKDILVARAGDQKAFLELARKFIEENPACFSAQDSTRIALGAAMSVVDEVPDPKRTRELLGIVRDWTRGRASDEDIEKAEKELWEMYDASPATASACSVFADSDRVTTWTISDALDAGARPQEIIESIEKETGPLDWFLASRGT